MQTFLPYRSFAQSVRILDMKRLGKQRVETLQIMKSHILAGEGLRGGWAAHPAARMWANHLNWLMQYQVATVNEWVSRGYRDTCLAKTAALYGLASSEQINLEPPLWLGKRILHSSHRSNLLRKDYERYSQFGWKEKPLNGYWWPELKIGGSGYIVNDETKTGRLKAVQIQTKAISTPGRRPEETAEQWLGRRLADGAANR